MVELIKLLNINMTSLKKVTRDFYNITKMKIVLYDEKRQILYSYPEHMCRFCSEIRNSPTLSLRCFECDGKGFDVCDKTKEKYIYTCHAGLTEAISPILENGIIIGYMMLGQVLENPDKPALTVRLAAMAEQYNINFELLRQEIGAMHVVSRDILSSATDMLEMCACYLWLKQIIRVHSYSLGQHLTHYIEKNLSGDLSIEALCRYLNVSKSTLYKLAIDDFNMGVSDYIRQKRLYEAESLLKRESLSISEIAAKVGIADANYFTKVFKRYSHMTPKEYRKAFKCNES